MLQHGDLFSTQVDNDQEDLYIPLSWHHQTQLHPSFQQQPGPFTSHPQDVQDQHVSQRYNRINPQRSTAHPRDNAYLQSDKDSGELLSPQLVELPLQKHLLAVWLACSYSLLALISWSLTAILVYRPLTLAATALYTLVGKRCSIYHLQIEHCYRPHKVMATERSVR